MKTSESLSVHSGLVTFLRVTNYCVLCFIPSEGGKEDLPTSTYDDSMPNTGLACRAHHSERDERNKRMEITSDKILERVFSDEKNVWLGQEVTFQSSLPARTFITPLNDPGTDLKDFFWEIRLLITNFSLRETYEHFLFFFKGVLEYIEYISLFP